MGPSARSSASRGQARTKAGLCARAGEALIRAAPPVGGSAEAPRRAGTWLRSQSVPEATRAEVELAGPGPRASASLVLLMVCMSGLSSGLHRVGARFIAAQPLRWGTGVPAAPASGPQDPAPRLAGY